MRKEHKRMNNSSTNCALNSNTYIPIEFIHLFNPNLEEERNLSFNRRKCNSKISNSLNKFELSTNLKMTSFKEKKGKVETEKKLEETLEFPENSLPIAIKFNEDGSICFPRYYYREKNVSIMESKKRKIEKIKNSIKLLKEKQKIYKYEKKYASLNMTVIKEMDSGEENNFSFKIQLKRLSPFKLKFPIEVD